MNIRLAVFVSFCFLILAGLASAQDNAVADDQHFSFKSPDEPDPGIPDTVYVDDISVPSGATNFTLPVYLYNDEELGGFNLPITWDSDDIICDSVSFLGSRVEYLNTKLFSIDTLNRRLQAGAVVFFEAYIQPGDGLAYTAYFSVAPGAADQVINIDSTFYPPGGNFALTLSSGFNILPQFKSGTITIGNPPTDPTISLSPTSFTFNAVQDEANPADQALSITNTGAGTLNWTASNNSAWLTLDPTSGTGDGSVTLSVDITGLADGIYYDTVTVSDPAATNDPQQAVVTLVVEPAPPTIVLNPTSFSYTITAGQSLANDQLAITNSGGGSLSWTAVNTSAWLTLSPTSGTGDGTVTMLFDVAGLTPGTYYDTITVSDPVATNDPQTSTIMLVVNEPPPSIVLSPTAFNYTITEGENVADDQLSITNGGGGTLEWTASNSTGWLALSPTSGTGDGTVTLSFDVSAVPAGTYYDTITVSDPNADNTPQIAPVTLTIQPPPPTISLSPTSFNYAITAGDALPDDQLTITNTGGGTLEWTASNQTGWITLSPVSGSGDGTVTLSFDVAGVPVGTYYDTITVSDPNATNDPQIATVMLTINEVPIPVIDVSPTEFVFNATEGGVNPASQTLTISNIGDGDLNWTVSESADWLTLDPLSGVNSGTVDVSVDMTGLMPGVYTTDIAVTDPAAGNSPVTVPVTFTIEALPQIAVSPIEFNYIITEGDALPDDQLTITNGGGGTLDWTVSNLTGWISLSPTAGTGDGAVTLSFDVSGVPVGTYYDTITVSDPAAANDPQTVPVMLTINPPPPVIALDPTLIELAVYEGETPADQQISVTNTGGGTLEWTAGNNTGWIALSPTSGTGDGLINLSFDLTGVGPGVYVDTVTVSDPAATNDPQQTVVQLTVYANDAVTVETVNAFVGEQVEVAVYYDNSTTTGQFTLPLSFDNTDVTCDSGSFQDTRVFPPDESLITIDNDNGTILIFGFAMYGPVVNPGSGKIARLFFTVDGDAATQFVTIDTTFIAPDGAYEFIDGNGDPKETDFTSGGIDISDTPCFDFPTDTVAFDFDLGDIVPSISFPVTNTCGGLLEWTVTGADSWLVLSPMSGTENDSITFSIDTAGLVPGSYMTTATFESNGFNTPYTVVVKLDLGGVPIIALTPDLIDLGQVCRGDTVIGSFDIDNAGYGDLNWHADAVEAISLSDYSGMAPSTVSFTIYTGEFDYGIVEAVVMVSSDNALNSPQQVTLKMSLINCDECTFDIAEVDGPEGMVIGVPVYTNGIGDVAGLQFNIGYDTGILTADSVTSAYMSGPTIGFSDQQIHYVWEDIVNPISVAQGETIMTLWFTVIGTVGQNSPLEWMGTNEISDPYGIPYGNVTYCGGDVTVIASSYSLSGYTHFAEMLLDSTRTPLAGVDVSLYMSFKSSTVTDDKGWYEFSDVSPGEYMVIPERTADDLGVSVGDVIKIRRHIADVEPFTSPFQMIAGDVNMTDNVTVSDVVLIRRYLAALDVLPSGNWAFVDAAFAIDMDNWHMAPNSADVIVTNQDIEQINFLGVRMGDVNFTWFPGMPASGRQFVGVELTIPDMIASSATDVHIPILVGNFNGVAGVEIHVDYGTDYIMIDSISSSILTDPTVNAADGVAHIIWDDFMNPLTLTDGDTLAIMHGHITNPGSAVVPLEFTARCELTDEIGDPFELVLNNGSLNVDVTDVDDDQNPMPLSFELKQNYPNPFNPSTTISYTVDKAMSLVFEVYNISGQLVDRRDLGRKNAGDYSFIYDGSGLASGVYTYRLTGEGVSTSRQMMLVK